MLTCNVLHYPRGALIAPSTKAHAGELAPHSYKTNSHVLGRSVLHSSKSIIRRAFDHSHHLSSCLPHLSLQFRSIIVSAVNQMLHQDLTLSGATTYLTLITLSLHFIPGLLNTSCNLSPFQPERTLNHLPYFIPFPNNTDGLKTTFHILYNNQSMRT